MNIINNIEEQNEYINDLIADVIQWREKFNTKNNEITGLEKALTCEQKQSFINLEPKYASNSSMASTPKEFIGEYRGNVTYNNWDVIWNDSKTAIHELQTKDDNSLVSDYFIVYYSEQGFSQKSVYWINMQCWLDK